MKRVTLLAGAVVLAFTGAIPGSDSALPGPDSPDSPVADAAMRGDVAVVRELLAGGADVNAAQGDGMTALHWAAEHGDAELARMLLHAGAAVAPATRIGSYAPLHIAARNGHTTLAVFLLEAGGDATAAAPGTGTTPLHLAAVAGAAELAVALIERGADINAREAGWGQTPLMFAASMNRVDAIRALLDAGADPDITSRVEDLVALSALDRLANRRRSNAIKALTAGRRPQPDRRGVPGCRAGGARGLRRRASRRRRGGRRGRLPSSADHREGWPDGAPARGSPRPPRGGGSTAGWRCRHRPSQRKRRHQPPPHGDDQRPVRPGPRADRKGRRSFRRVCAQRRNPALGCGERTLAAPHPLSATPGDGAPDGHLRGRDGSAPGSGRGPGRAAHAPSRGTWSTAGAATATAASSTPKARPRSGGPRTRPTWRRCGSWPHTAPTPMSPPRRLRRGAAFRRTNPSGSRTGDSLPPTPPIRNWRTPGAWRSCGRYATTSRPTCRTDFPDDLLDDLDETVREDLVRASAVGDSLRALEPDASGLPPVDVGGPGVWPIHAASGVGYGEGFAGNAHRHAPDGWLPAVRYLVEELGADVNARDHNGYNALHHAAARGDHELIIYLVERGGDIRAVSRRGQTVADLANGPVQRVSPLPATVALAGEAGVGQQPSLPDLLRGRATVSACALVAEPPLVSP